MCSDQKLEAVLPLRPFWGWIEWKDSYRLHCFPGQGLFIACDALVLCFSCDLLKLQIFFFLQNWYLISYYIVQFFVHKKQPHFNWSFRPYCYTRIHEPVVKTNDLFFMFVERNTWGYKHLHLTLTATYIWEKGPLCFWKLQLVHCQLFCSLFSKLSVITDHLGEKTGIKLLLKSSSVMALLIAVYLPFKI